MNKFFHWTTGFFSTLSIGHIVTIASPSQAAIINGSFENGLSNWNTKGNVLSFDWNFLSNDDFLEDYAFVVLKNNLSVIANITNLTNTSNTVFAQQTGVKTFFILLIPLVTIHLP